MHSNDGAAGSTIGNDRPPGLQECHRARATPTRAPRTHEDDEEAFALVEAVAARVADQLPGLGFLAPNGLLDLPIDHGRLVELRLELPPGRSLHVQSIGLTADGVDDLTARSTLIASSWHGTSRERFDLARLLDVDHPSGTLIHTDADDPSWVELRFARPVRLTRVRVRNVPNGSAEQARGLVVSVTSTFRRRDHTVYDGRADLRELDRILGPVRAVGAVNPLLAGLLPTLEHTLRGDYPAALAAIAAATTVDHADRRRLRTVLNGRLLASRQREWTEHGREGAIRFGSAA